MSNKTKILILGGGFGGVYAALRLDKTLARRADVEVTLVSRDNFLLFTPMLHEVASGDLNPGDIVNPIRRMLKRVLYVQADVRSIDLAAKRVHCTRDLRQLPLELDYDHLVLALGSETNFFGMQGVAENAVTMKTLGDAALLRARVLGILEAASLEPDAAVRKRMLTFVVAGGGFAGVETIGAINDLVREALRYYPRLAPQEVRVVLVHPGEVVLPELGEKLGRYAQQKLVGRGVEIRPGTKVTGFDGSLVTVALGEPIPASTLIWTAGVAPDPVIAGLPCRKEKGRVVVDEFLEVPGWRASGRWATAPPCPTQHRPAAAADGAARAATSPARSEEHRGGPRRPSEEALPLLHHWPARVDRPPARRRKHPRPEFLRLHRLVPVAKRLLAQAPAAGEEDPRGALLDAGDDLLEGPRADADPSGHRVPSRIAASLRSDVAD